MALEKKWPAVPPRLFTADGGQFGRIEIQDTAGFKVKQIVVVQATGQPMISLQVKRVIDDTTLILGPIQDGIKSKSNLSAYGIANSAYIYAEEQDKAKLKSDDIDQAVYDQEPTVALRSVMVDEYGRYYTEDNPMPIVFGGSVAIGNVTIQDDDGDELGVNPDGSINVNVISAASSNPIKSIYNEANAVPSGVETVIVQYTVPALMSSAYLQRITVSGENVGRYQVFINDELIDTKRTYFGGDFNQSFEYATGPGDGLMLETGDVVEVRILHDRPSMGNFEGRIQALEID